jgi:hypothetical protein
MIARTIALMFTSMLACGVSAQVDLEPCLIAHYDGSALLEGQPPGPLNKFGIGVIVRGTLTGAGAPYAGPTMGEGLYDFQTLAGQALTPSPPIINEPQVLNAFGLFATSTDYGAMVSDIFGGPITPPGNVGHGAVYPLVSSSDALPTPLTVPYPYVYQFGVSLGHVGSLLLIGAPETTINGQQLQGAAYAYIRDGEDWVLEAELIGPSTNQFDRNGWSSALSADGLAMIGAIGASANSFNSNGAAFAFRRTSEGRWVYEQTLTEPFGQPGDIDFGYATAMSEDGSTAVITAPDADGQDGAAYVYHRVDEQWQFVQKVTPSNPVGSFPTYGFDVAISDDASFLAVGNSEDSEAGFSAGALYVYRRNDGTGLYDEVAKLLPPDPSFDDDFAASVDIDGDLLVAGQVIDYEDGGVGGIYVYAGVLGMDCNGNGAPDSCDIAAGTSLDNNGDGVPDECEGTPDFDGDGDVDPADLATLLAGWGACGGPPKPCPADLDFSGDVGPADLAALLAVWGTVAQ